MIIATIVITKYKVKIDPPWNEVKERLTLSSKDSNTTSSRAVGYTVH